MQDDGIHANLRFTQQAHVATVMKVTHATFVQLSENYLSAKNNFLRHLEPECQWHRCSSFISASWLRIKISKIREAVLCTGTSSFK